MAKTLITANEAAKEVFDVLKASSISISGNIYLDSRPLNSDKEDIVVRTLAMGADQRQSGIVNVNIHVPNLHLIGDNTQPDRSRLNTIGNACLYALDDVWGRNFNFHLQNAGTMETDGKEWFLNIRVRFNSIRVTETV